MTEEIRKQAESFATEAIKEDFKWENDEYNWVREKGIRDRVFNTVADIKYDLILKEILLSKANRDNANLKLENKQLEEFITEINTGEHYKPVFACGKCKHYVKSPVSHRTIMYCKLLDHVVTRDFGCIKFESKQIA